MSTKTKKLKRTRVFPFRPLPKGPQGGIELLLIHSVESLGKQGEVVEVRPGYAYNYLIPHGLATLASDHHKRSQRHRGRPLVRQRRPDGNRRGPQEQRNLAVGGADSARRAAQGARPLHRQDSPLERSRRRTQGVGRAGRPGRSEITLADWWNWVETHFRRHADACGLAL